MLAVVDYGMSNMKSVLNAFRHLDVTVSVVDEPREAEKARALIIPGVGAFADAMKKLRSTGWDEALSRAAEKDVPLLGICLGMQIFFSRSHEVSPGDDPRGLDIISGEVVPMEGNIEIPHMGWNRVHLDDGGRLWRGIPPRPHMYFAHSYRVAPAKPSALDGLGWTDHGRRFVSFFRRGSVVGVQFHPEKSGRWGLRLLSNFARRSKLRGGSR